jgi:ABC-2 type transport system permease protein
VDAVGVIFKRELGVYLRSPVGYLVAATVLLLDGLLFYAQALGPSAGERLSGEVLAAFFYNASGLTAVAAVALSIRLVAEERHAGTLVLLNTSPLRDWEIIVGKYLSALAFLTSITLATLYMPLLILVNGRISVAQVLVGYLGLVLLGAAVLAIGVFASSLTRHQLLAAAIASLITATLFLMWPLSRVVDPPVALVFAGLAIHGRHFAGFQAGLLHTRDVFYYLALVYFFLLSATKVMEAKRWE